MDKGIHDISEVAADLGNSRERIKETIMILKLWYRDMIIGKFSTHGYTLPLKEAFDDKVLEDVTIEGLLDCMEILVEAESWLMAAREVSNIHAIYILVAIMHITADKQLFGLNNVAMWLFLKI